MYKNIPKSISSESKKSDRLSMSSNRRMMNYGKTSWLEYYATFEIICKDELIWKN